MQAPEAGRLLAEEEGPARTLAGKSCGKGAGAAVVGAAILALLATAALVHGGVGGGPPVRRRIVDVAAERVEAAEFKRRAAHAAQGTSKVGKVKPKLATVKPKAPCVWKGGDCTQSHCCLDGGDYGFQCYQRDETWAVCEESCESGVHEEGDYDKSGNPIQANWTCKELGKRSDPGCQVFEETKCPRDRCEWKADKCKSPCPDFPDEDTCKGQEECSWHDDNCIDACWVYGPEKVCSSLDNKDRCVQKSDRCAPGCWTFFDSDNCMANYGCIWNRAGYCEDDPCSAPGENCVETKCCSAGRGGGSMTCFQKDEFYASCSKSCDQSDEWNCTALGERTKTDPHCSWAGKDCSATGLCCNVGFECMKKDEDFMGCVQTFKMGIVNKSLEKIPMDLPPDWPADPEFVGNGQLEYEVAKAHGEALAGTSLYCFMAYLPGSYEERLMEVARANNASVFACDAHDIFQTWQSNYVDWDTAQRTLQNTEVFIDVWNQVKEVGHLWTWDWTVKVDPDCLLVPFRLKWHLGDLKIPKATAVYVKNNDLGAAVGNNGFLGAVEAFSREALELYYDWWPECKATLGLGSGEDGFMKGCMDALGVGYVVDAKGFKPDDDVDVCKDQKWSAYHPMKDQMNYQCCIDIIKGIARKTYYGDCSDMPDDWANLTWPGAGYDGVEPRWRREPMEHPENPPPEDEPVEV